MSAVLELIKFILKRYWQEVFIILLLYLLIKRNMQNRKILKWMALLSAKIDALSGQKPKEE